MAPPPGQTGCARTFVKYIGAVQYGDTCMMSLVGIGQSPHWRTHAHAIDLRFGHIEIKFGPSLQCTRTLLPTPFLSVSLSRAHSPLFSLSRAGDNTLNGVQFILFGVCVCDFVCARLNDTRSVDTPTNPNRSVGVLMLQLCACPGGVQLIYGRV